MNESTTHFIRDALADFYFEPHRFCMTDAFVGGHVDLVKMDCEGAEWEILGDHESWQKVNFLTMEYHLTAGQRHQAVIPALKRIGCTVRSYRPATNFALILAQRKL